MEVRLKLSKSSSSPPVDTTLYQSLVRSLRYLIHTRPDLAYSVGYVNRFMERLCEEHLIAVKHILRYVAGTKTLGVLYTVRKKKSVWPCLLGYNDSDMAGDIDDRKSTFGMIFFLDSNPITW
ncbi:secreted RxLR effector protein 161-like [Phragmites australis]|uniref:secreted RxLR effector protein 161-like n=1 Tax=Phragmites australis TaxID=29695 RepID=UPI002D79511C|nr:secreted RxLR effector protein 161-like [Phragmites australis]